MPPKQVIITKRKPIDSSEATESVKDTNPSIIVSSTLEPASVSTANPAPTPTPAPTPARTHVIIKKPQVSEIADKSKPSLSVTKVKPPTVYKKDVKNKSSLPDLFNDDNVDYRYIMANYDFSKNTTRPFITTYEKCKLIGTRAKQIESGAITDIDVKPGQTVISITEEELRLRKMPLLIKRTIGDRVEYWKLADMEVDMD
jgi:DNA-directed RNA polymerase I, II, and III subunit RPABC2